MMQTAAAAFGHNSMSDAEIIRAELDQSCKELMDRRDQLIAAVERAPDIITDEETAGRVADFIKQISAAIKLADGERTRRKQPWLDGGRTVDGFFKTVTGPLDDAKKQIQGRLTAWQRARAEEERQRRMAEERAAREAAEKAARDAAEAAAKLESEDDLESAIAAEEAARIARESAEKAAQDAVAKAADMHRARGDYGSTASLRTFWDFRDMDSATLDLEALRPYLAHDALEKAVRAAIRAGVREMRGVVIFENQKSIVS